MFDDYAKKLEKLGEDVPKIFKIVAKKSAIHFRNEAVKLTNEEGLVDTGNYRRNWNGEAIEPQKDVYGVVGTNSVEYASHLEWGHKLRNGKRWKGRFVGKKAMTETEGFALMEVFDALQIAMMSKKFKISKEEAKKIYNAR